MPDLTLRSSQRLHGFVVDRVEDIPELRSQAVLCTHEKTGARLVHLHNDDPNNLFCIGFRTPVYDNTGVPHILEHSVLSGSRKFPLKDPFKEMLKGSLQTFLNAMTYPDKTIYPVSSQVETDFYNLVDVYCDAVLHPLLSETTFSQEGWHFDAETLTGAIGIKGIVYNEMKGVFSDFRSHVFRRTLSALYPDTTYSFESGGDPEHIPSLTYERFKAFHAAFYHPSNAFIFLYGNIPTATTLAFLEDRYLKEFDRREVDSTVAAQPLWDGPRTVHIEAPSAKEDEGRASVIVCWIFDRAADPVSALLGTVLSRYLLATESSPLRRALVDSGLGEDLDDMTGFDNDLVQSLFSAGLRKTRPEHAPAIDTLVTHTLRKQVEQGLDEELLEGAIRQTEFRLREISDSGHLPHNLMLAERCFRSWLYGGDPLAHLRFEEPLSVIKREKAEGSGFFVHAIRERLLENPHRLLSVIVASSRMGEALGKLTERQAKHLTESFGEKERRTCFELTQRLLENQKKPPSAEALASLPRLNKADLPPQNPKVPTELLSAADVPVYAHPIFSSGIVYLDIGFDLSVVPLDLLRYFPLYSHLISRCGAAGFTFEQMAKRVSLSTGGIGCSDLCAARPERLDDIVCKAVFHGKSLGSRFAEMIDILGDLFCEPKFDDTKLLKDTILEMRNEFNAAVVGNGHVLAGANASSRLSKVDYVIEVLEGIAQLRFLDDLAGLDDVGPAAQRIAELHRVLMNRRGCFASLTADAPQEYVAGVERLLGRLDKKDAPPTVFDFAADGPRKPRGIEISSSVNFVAKAWRLDGLEASNVGPLMIMSKYLSTGFLWEKVRIEGGAYGGKAFASSTHPTFLCSSYRDPNLSATLANFEEALKHVARQLPAHEVDQSIIGTIGLIDSPKAPHRKGLGETYALVCGRTPQYRQAIRETVLRATPQTLAEKAHELQKQNETAVTVLGSSAAFDQAQKDGVQLLREALLAKSRG